MQTQFEHELDRLKKRITKMNSLAYSQVVSSLKVLTTGVFDEIPVIEKTEHRIDKLDVKIDKLCQRIFALQQPVASDLRFIMASLRIGNELERIGDLAMSIINKTEIVRERPEIIEKFKIDDIAVQCESIAKKTFEGYVFNDTNLIEEIFIINKEIKNRCQIALNEIIFEMTQKSEVIVVATNLILILRYIERLADHYTNITESLSFMVHGDIIKHKSSHKVSNNTEEEEEEDNNNEKS